MNEIEQLQNEVLIGIGRNVLNLQKMEGMLKSLVVSVNSNAPIGNPEEAIRERQKTVSKMSMGRLVGDFVRSIYPNYVAESSQTENCVTETVEHSVRFEDRKFVDELEASLKTVVKERNDLIHEKLIEFDPKSPDSCRILANELENQRQRIRPQFEALAAIWSAVRDHLEELREYIDSDQFESDLKIAREQGRATNH